MVADSGAYPYLSPYVLLYATIMAPGPYRIDNLRVDSVAAAMVAAIRLNKYPESKVLFLAPTKPLAVQHKKTFSKILAVEDTTVLTGEVKIEDRKRLWEASRIIYATPQTIENDITRGLDLATTSLVVFDNPIGQ